MSIIQHLLLLRRRQEEGRVCQLFNTCDQEVDNKKGEYVNYSTLVFKKKTTRSESMSIIQHLFSRKRQQEVRVCQVFNNKKTTRRVKPKLHN